MYDLVKAYKENFERLKRVAEKKEYIFNPNEDWVKQVITLMCNNLKEFGKYFCPCKQHHPVEPEIDPVCPCKSLDDEIERDGHCHCRLFFKPGTEKARMNILGTIACPG